MAGVGKGQEAPISAEMSDRSLCPDRTDWLSSRSRHNNRY